MREGEPVSAHEIFAARQIFSRTGLWFDVLCDQVRYT
jgi:hypothetical protein